MSKTAAAPAAAAAAAAAPASERKAKKAAKAPTAKAVKFTIDCHIPVEDGNIIKPAELEKFFHDRVKVGGKANTGKVTVSRNATRVTVSAPAPFSKRYVKYLTKKFLKKNGLREWLRVVATTKNTYELRYFNIQDEAEPEAAAGADE